MCLTLTCVTPGHRSALIGVCRLETAVWNTAAQPPENMHLLTDQTYGPVPPSMNIFSAIKCIVGSETAAK